MKTLKTNAAVVVRFARNPRHYWSNTALFMVSAQARQRVGWLLVWHERGYFVEVAR